MSPLDAWDQVRAILDQAPPAVHTAREYQEPLGSFARLIEVLLLAQAPAKHVEALLAIWHQEEWLTPAALGQGDFDELRTTASLAQIPIKPATLGLVRNFALWVHQQMVRIPQEPLMSAVDLPQLVTWDTESLRQDWRRISGIGAALADDLLLLGLGRAVVPIDRSAYRIFVRHGWLDPGSEEAEVRAVFQQLAVWEPSANHDPDAIDSLAHAEICMHRTQALAKIAKSHCKVRGPQCQGCPLESLLPPQGPYEPEA